MKDVIVTREEVEIKRTVIVPPNEQEELVTERFTEFVDQEGNQRRVVVYEDESGEEKRVVLSFRPLANEGGYYTNCSQETRKMKTI